MAVETTKATASPGPCVAFAFAGLRDAGTRGRFRGRYYIDEHSPGGHHDIDIEARDLHDGVKAWLRGFRDVEEGVKARGGISRGRQSNLHGNLKDGVVEEEWGDFESAP